MGLEYGKTYERTRSEVRAERISRNMKEIKGIDGWDKADEEGFRRVKYLEAIALHEDEAPDPFAGPQDRLRGWSLLM